MIHREGSGKETEGEGKEGERKGEGEGVMGNIK